MMALFIVLWLMNSSEKIRKAISAYFNDPSGTGQQTGSATAGTGETLSLNKDNMANSRSELEQALKKSPEFEKLKDYVQMSVTGEGLRIEMLESEKGIFFESGSAAPSDAGKEMIVTPGRPNWAGCPNRCDDRRSHRFASVLADGRITPTGSSPRIAPTPRAGSWSKTECGRDRSYRCAASRIRNCATRTIRRPPQTAESR